MIAKNGYCVLCDIIVGMATDELNLERNGKMNVIGSLYTGSVLKFGDYTIMIAHTTKLAHLASSFDASITSPLTPTSPKLLFAIREMNNATAMPVNTIKKRKENAVKMREISIEERRAVTYPNFENE